MGFHGADSCAHGLNEGYDMGDPPLDDMHFAKMSSLMTDDGDVGALQSGKGLRNPSGIDVTAVLHPISIKASRVYRTQSIAVNAWSMILQTKII